MYTGDHPAPPAGHQGTGAAGVRVGESRVGKGPAGVLLPSRSLASNLYPASWSLTPRKPFTCPFLTYNNTLFVHAIYEWEIESGFVGESAVLAVRKFPEVG
jgi:hypothetical protein